MPKINCDWTECSYNGDKCCLYDGNIKLTHIDNQSDVDEYGVKSIEGLECSQFIYARVRKKNGSVK